MCTIKLHRRNTNNIFFFFCILVDVHDVIYRSYETEIFNITVAWTYRRTMHILILQLYTSQFHDDPQPCLPSPWQCRKWRSSRRRSYWRRKWRQRPIQLGRGKRRKQPHTVGSVLKIDRDVHNSFCANNSCSSCTSI